MQFDDGQDKYDSNEETPYAVRSRHYREMFSAGGTSSERPQKMVVVSGWLRVGIFGALRCATTEERWFG